MAPSSLAETISASHGLQFAIHGVTIALPTTLHASSDQQCLVLIGLALPVS